MRQTDTAPLYFCGQPVSSADFKLIIQIVNQYHSLSRTELASTVCELLAWSRPTGKPKTVECRQFLESLHERNLIQLPHTRHRGRGKSQRTTLTELSAEDELLQGTLRDFRPVSLQRVKTPEQRKLFRELIERHHYLGYRTPFGAHLCYTIEIIRPRPRVVGCLQLSSPAWRMAPRDRWIGWSDAVRARHLQRIVSNSRFLIVPSARIKFLASHVLSLLGRCLANDWEEQYQLRPVLLETLVDARRFSGSCYRAANWLELGQTSGRGRDDKAHARHAAAPKRVFVYPLRANARECLQPQCGTGLRMSR